MIAAALPIGAWHDGRRDGLSYCGLGLPLAFVALPLYVVLPKHYASAYGVPLALLGAVLFGARLLDALVDPLIGRWADELFASSPRRAWRVLAAAAVILALGLRALFFPAVDGTMALLRWCAAGLAVTCLSYSTVSVIHQAWGARLGGDEALALAGVLVASVLPSLAGFDAATLVFTTLLLAPTLLLRRAPQPAVQRRKLARASLALPWATPAFRRLVAIYLCSGIASAVPATLVLFFIRDHVQAPAFEPLFLASYFAAGALSIPLRVRLVARYGLARSWLVSMGLAIATFAWATRLGTGDVAEFSAVCLASGVALGADLTLPSALLTGVIQQAGHAQRAERSYMGWWNFATKLNLALAAGLALPALQAFGYAPGMHHEAALSALSAAYCLLPCALKLAAAALLHFTLIRAEDARP